MRRILLSLAAVLALAAPAAAQQTKAQLNTEVSANFPDNTSGLITPAILRTTVNDMIASWQQAPRVNAQTGTTYTFVVGDYGFLVTFSNTSPVAVTLPQATGTFTTWNAVACNNNTGAVTITPTTSTINGAATMVLQQGQCRAIVSDGTNYQTMGSSVQAVTCAASQWINAINSSFVPSCAQPAFTDISGTLQPNKGGTGATGVPSSGQVLIGNGTVYAPQSISGDASVTSAGVWTNTKVNGVSYPPSPSTNTVPVVTSSNQTTYQPVPNAALANSAITLNAGSGTGLSAPGSMALGSTNTLGSTSDTPRFAGLGLGCASSGANLLSLCGSSSGKVDLRSPAVAGSNTITFPAGTTDFSATGGASQVVKQASAGGAFTVGQLGFTDIANTLGAAQVATTTITGQTVNNSPSASNDYVMYYNAADGAVRRATVGSIASGATAGVSSLNGLTGGLSVVNGTGISVSAGGSSVTVNVTGLGATDNAALRADGTGGGTPQGSALIIADTTASLTRSGNGGVPIQGTNTNDNAASGFVGEFLESSIASGSAVNVPLNTATEVTHTDLTAGDWECWGQVNFDPDTTTTATLMIGSLNTSVALPTPPAAGARNEFRINFGAGLEQTIQAGRRRVSVAAPTTVYLIAYSTFTVSTMAAYGYLGCRRMR